MKFPSILLFALAAIVSITSCKEPAAPDPFGGLALYTLREDMKTNPKQVLADVHDIGYAYIEDAGYANGTFYGMEPAAFKAYLDSVGLRPVSSHQSGITYENAAQTLADLKEVGFTYIVIPIPPMGTFTFDPATRTMGMKGSVDSLAMTLDSLGKMSKAAGLQLLYHNHDFEFKADSTGVVPLNYLLEHCDPDLVNFQLDLYWATKAGVNPVDYFAQYPGRFKSWHVKDMDEQGRFAPVGTGSIDFTKILAEKDQAGMQYYFVEQDMTFDGQAPMEAIKISHKAIDSLGFE